MFLRQLRATGGNEFWNDLCSHLMESAILSDERAVARAYCKSQSAMVFRADLDATLWRRLGQQKHLLPLRDVTREEDSLLQQGIWSEHYSAATDVEYDFLNVPWELRGVEYYAKGSSITLDVTDETLPGTKYAALFGGRPAFHGLRFSFLQQVCGHHLSDVDAAMQQEPRSEATLHLLYCFFAAASPGLEPGQSFADAPPDLINSAWPVLRQCTL